MYNAALLLNHTAGEQETHKPFVEGSTPSLATSDLGNLYRQGIQLSRFGGVRSLRNYVTPNAGAIRLFLL